MHPRRWNIDHYTDNLAGGLPASGPSHFCAHHHSDIRALAQPLYHYVGRLRGREVLQERQEKYSRQGHFPSEFCLDSHFPLFKYHRLFEIFPRFKYH